MNMNSIYPPNGDRRIQRPRMVHLCATVNCGEEIPAGWMHCHDCSTEIRALDEMWSFDKHRRPARSFSVIKVAAMLIVGGYCLYQLCVAIANCIASGGN
jgi:hypothetical protein